MSRGPDAATLLERALLEKARTAGCVLELEISAMTRWASATFTGARHLIRLTGERGATLDAWLTALPEAEFALRGHVVADLVVLSLQRTGAVATVVLEALTVEAR